MGIINWEKAPVWADRVIQFDFGAPLLWSDGCIIQEVGKIINPISRKVETVSAYIIERRPDAWQEGEERMDNIGQNGNDGHYEEVQDFTKQPRYKDENGLDWVDEFAANNSIEDFRAAMRFTIGKYERRLGKKDELSKELYKISDYYARWSQVELEAEK